MWEYPLTKLSLIATSLWLLYRWITRHHCFWSRHGVVFVRPQPLVGTMMSAIRRTTSFLEMYQMNYNELKCHKFGGIFEFMTPKLLVTDPKIISDITKENAHHFTYHHNIIRDPQNHFGHPSMKTNEWREMCSLLSPAFTTNKLHAMFPLITKCGHQFARFLVTREDAYTEPLEFKAAFTRLTNDVIASTAFGVKCNSVQNPETEFYKQGQNLINFNGLRFSLVIAFTLFPKLMRWLKISFTPKKVSQFFMDIINKAIQHREASGEVRPDMLQLLVDAQKSSTAHNQQCTLLKGCYEKKDVFTAHAVPFFFAGFDAVATVLGFLAHELAVNPDVQERLRDEVDAALMSNENVLKYETVQNLKYLDMVISECLRKYPAAGMTDRYCKRDFRIPGTDVVIENKISISIPVFAIHRDEVYFPKPDKFDPERFSDENKEKIRPHTYLPFGSGPYKCPGMQLALLELKVAICYLLATCQLLVCEKTEVPIKLSRKTFHMTTDAGFWLLSIPRDDPTIDIAIHAYYIPGQ